MVDKLYTMSLFLHCIRSQSQRLGSGAIVYGTSTTILYGPIQVATIPIPIASRPPPLSPPRWQWPPPQHLGAQLPLAMTTIVASITIFAWEQQLRNVQTHLAHKHLRLHPQNLLGECHCHGDHSHTHHVHEHRHLQREGHPHLCIIVSQPSYVGLKIQVCIAIDLPIQQYNQEQLQQQQELRFISNRWT